MLTELSRTLRQRLSLPLPGPEAQYKMAHAERRLNSMRFKVPENPRKGAVIILLYETKNAVRFPLIVRSEYEGVHSGQVALPGGSLDETDADLRATAIREAEEETGVQKKHIEILGELTELYIPPSNFLVRPYVAMYKSQPLFVPHAREVSRIVEMNLENILDESKIGEKKIQMSNGVTVLTPFFDLDGLTVWGATAMILSEFKSVLFEVSF
jgi:8-oxo-dGTP pyrophosphatase MutT (NUDIX family)